MITFSVDEDEQTIIKTLREFTYRNLPFNIMSVEDESLPKAWYGGTKYLECNILLGAFNHLDIKPLVAYMRGMVWERPEDVQMIIKRQWESKFRIIDVFPEDQ
ncbi:hypothetical protein H8B15_17710 [Hymenobacter sp. BT507]|uniref:Uncharacterized protein n=1 Tax=Hymenobacter citatus TaxID=2763506 RepID=A0ABR7MPD7_9BACT|nr:hypothetical protein [Hymenobacter citatus]MBC6612764.1 hypothetical protein [Hymenobacter citatus]